jgi:cytochrome c biogenesis protein
VILLGGLLGVLFGFHDTQFMVAEGSSQPVPTKPGTSIHLVSFQDTYDPDTGAPIDYASDVIVTRDGQQIAHQVVRVNDPLRFDDITFYQSFFGSAAVIKAADSAGRTVYDDGVPMGWTADDGRSVGSFALPSANLTVWVVGTTGNDDTLVRPGQVRLELYDTTTGNPVTQQTVDLGTPTTVDGVSFTFEKETKFAGLSVAKDPGAPLVWLGSFLLVGGFALVFMLPHRRIWGRIVARPNGGSMLSMASIGRNDTAQENEFTALVTEIRQAFHAPARA